MDFGERREHDERLNVSSIVEVFNRGETIDAVVNLQNRLGRVRIGVVDELSFEDFYQALKQVVETDRERCFSDTI